MLKNSLQYFTEKRKKALTHFCGRWYNLSMLTGKCPKCGWDFYGWALSFPRNQMCGNCGTALSVFEDGKKVSDGYSPFTAEEYKIAQPQNDAVPSDKPKSSASEG
ncbi:hypothetical protein ACFLUP_00440 [Chloroflexota bacterium]